jgi:hypothetical protein
LYPVAGRATNKRSREGHAGDGTNRTHRSHRRRVTANDIKENFMFTYRAMPQRRRAPRQKQTRIGGQASRSPVPSSVLAGSRPKLSRTCACGGGGVDPRGLYNHLLIVFCFFFSFCAPGIWEWQANPHWHPLFIRRYFLKSD